MTIGLAMIVRDEASAIERALAQALPIVDHVTVLDTGSSDETVPIARRALADVSHAIHETEWKGFGSARTELLALTRRRGCDYTLMLDADHTLHIAGDCPELEADEYMLQILDSWGGRLPLLTRTQHRFEYRGVAHSYLHSDAPTTRANLDWLSIDGGPGTSRAKIEGDRTLLEQAFLDDPNDARTVFYLAQTYRDLDQPELAIRFYLMRADMAAGFDEERYFARYQAGVLLSEHVSFDRGADELLKAWRARPSRAEALRALANAAASVADKIPVPADILFVQPHAYKEAA